MTSCTVVDVVEFVRPDWVTEEMIKDVEELVYGFDSEWGDPKELTQEIFMILDKHK